MTYRKFIAWCCLVVAPPISAESLYAIGNSLTNDSYPAAGIGLLAQEAGANLVVGYHIRGSASLTYMVSNPSDATLSQPSTWATALPAGDYDFVTVQPYLGIGNPTAGSELDAIAQIVEVVLAGSTRQVVFCLYEAWPNQYDTLGDYHAYWTQTTAYGAALPPLQTRHYYDQMLQGLRDRFGGRAIFRVIPVGDVFDRIDTEARAERIPGIASMEMLYRDPIHMGEVGRFVAATTLLSTVLKRRVNVAAAIAVYQFNDGEAELTAQLATDLEELIWTVVANDPRTGTQGAVNSGESTVVGGQAGQGTIRLEFIAYALLLLALRRGRRSMIAPSRVQS